MSPDTVIAVPLGTVVQYAPIRRPGGLAPEVRADRDPLRFPDSRAPDRRNEDSSLPAARARREGDPASVAREARVINASRRMGENETPFLGRQPDQVDLVQFGARPEGEQAGSVRRPIPDGKAALERRRPAACNRGLYQN